jgi:type IV secretion system protein VirD4
MKNDKRKKTTKWLCLGTGLFWLCYLAGFGLTCALRKRFDIRYLASGECVGIAALLIGVGLLLGFLYYRKHYWLINSKNIMKGKPSDLHFGANLEQSRFMSEEEIQKAFTTVAFEDLKESDAVGSPIRAAREDGTLQVTFAKPAHSMVIGTTGSGKTTTYVSPTIQILCETKTKPSMLISDPKGELYSAHGKHLADEGYEVKVLDLRRPYQSVRWNPLERSYERYQKALHLEDEAVADEERGAWVFEGNDYFDKEKLDAAIQVRRQELNDLVYEDLNDIATALCPVENKTEPMWESGAKNLVLAIMLAMLEDSANPETGMCKEKYNFFSLMKIATSTDDDCAELIAYFKNRSPLSKAVSLSKQVLASSDKTRGSYLSSTFDKISIFADQSLCALTSGNEIEFGSMGERPIALFLQIPDEKETRHTLASLAILQAYKELVEKANEYPNLTLPKPVYFILDEFGNLPKIHKMEQMVTVGRSRNIWLDLVVQSYSQLAKVYDEKAADIIKSNCNIQVFIGTTDLKTIEDFSKRCGNYTVVERSVGFNSVKGEDVTSNQSAKERPLIYPSELQLLNRPGDMGHAIVTVFGYNPINSYFEPCFKTPEYSMGQGTDKPPEGRYFDEAKAFYDLRKRNQLSAPATSEEPQRESLRRRMVVAQISEIAKEGCEGILAPEDWADLEGAIETLSLGVAIPILNKALDSATDQKKDEQAEQIKDAIKRLSDYVSER